MRLVILSDQIPPESSGGAGKVAWMLARGLRDLGYDLHVIAATPQATFRAVRDGIPTYHLHSQYPPRWRSWLSLYNPQVIHPLRDLLNQIKPDVVNAHNVHQDLSYASLSIAHQLGLPTVLTVHDMMPVAYTKMDHFVRADTCSYTAADYCLPPLFNLKQNRFRYNPIRNWVIRRILSRAVDVRIAMSRAHQAALEANGLPPFQVVHNGLDLSEFAPPDPVAIEQLRTRLKLNGCKVVLFGGRMSALKGSAQLLQALDRLIPTMPEIRLLVLSNTPVEPSMLAGLQHLKREHLCETGWLTGAALTAAYYLADVVTFPSICMDTFGLMNLEGMAAGKPLVSTCFGGSPEIVVDGETGYIVNPLDTAMFADRLGRLLADADLRARLGSAGRARLVAAFTLQHQVERMDAIFKKIM